MASQTSPPPRTPDLILAFRTITTMLNILQHAPLTTKDVQNMHLVDTPVRREGRILSALANLLVRQDEVTAVVSKPDQDVRDPTPSQPGENTTLSQPRMIPDPTRSFRFREDTHMTPPCAIPNPSIQDQALRNCFTTLNPRRAKKAIPGDAMTFTGQYPTIFESHGAIVDIRDPLSYALTCWKSQPFQDHAQSLVALLRRDPAIDKITQERNFFAYVVAKSFPKMHHRIDHSKLSFPFFNSLISLGPFIYKSSSTDRPIPSPYLNLDISFLHILPQISARANIKIPYLTNLAQSYANDSASLPIYNASTCNEYHQVLCTLLRGLRDGLASLKQFQPSQGHTLLEQLIDDVLFYSMILHSMVYGSWMETHLQEIADLLITSHSRSASNTNNTGEIEDIEGEDTELRSIQPSTVQGDRPLPVWEAFRDWLRLIVSYFEASSIVSNYVNIYGPESMSIKVIGILHQGQDMLSWMDLASLLFERKPAYAALSMENSTARGKVYSASKDGVNPALRDNIIPTPEDDANFTLEDVTDSSLEYSTDTSSEDGSEELDTDAVWANGLVEITNVDEFSRAISILQGSSTYFSDAFEGGSPLSMGNRFTGTIHCEAFIACLIYLAHSSGKKVNSSLLQEFSGMNYILGISKRCCPVCSHLLYALQGSLPGAVFNTPGSHKTVYPCTLPPWLPAPIIVQIVLAFWEQLRKVLLDVLRNSVRRERRKSTGSHGATPTNLYQHGGWIEMLSKSRHAAS